MPGLLPAVCILAGGRGTRLGPMVREIPKPLLDVAGKPFLLHSLHSLAAQGVNHVVLCVGYLGRLVEEVVGPRHFGIKVEYSYDGVGLDGTLGAIRRALPLLGEQFLVLYGDTYLQIDYRAFVTAWRRSGLPAAMAVLHNRGRWDQSNAVYIDGLVQAYDKWSPDPAAEWIDYGLAGLSRRALAFGIEGESDLAPLYHTLASDKQLLGFEVSDRFYEIGTPAALKEAEQYLRSLGK